MNYLAHAYLSFKNPAWITGNLVSDFIKGKRRYDYSQGVQEGITLHRAIDEFTDSHAIIKEAKEIFRPHYRLYAGAFIDVAFDHFLANDKKRFADEKALADFAAFVYKSLKEHYAELPPQFQKIFGNMQQHDWLYNYRLKWGMERSFAGLVYRSKYLEESETAFRLFEERFDDLQVYYNLFFPGLFEFAEQSVITLKDKQ